MRRVRIRDGFYKSPRCRLNPLATHRVNGS